MNYYLIKYNTLYLQVCCPFRQILPEERAIKSLSSFGDSSPSSQQDETSSNYNRDSESQKTSRRDSSASPSIPNFSSSSSSDVTSLTSSTKLTFPKDNILNESNRKPKANREMYST